MERAKVRGIFRPRQSSRRLHRAPRAVWCDDHRDGTWLARRNRTGRWVRITGTGRGPMSGVFKSIEMVGTSGQSFEDAVRTAVKRAGETMRDLEWMEVVEQRGYIRGGEIHEYQVKVKLWFKLEGGEGGS
jgi:flavin-binding protein dodecin